MSELDRAKDLILGQYPIAQTWEPDALEDWVLWADRNRFLVTAYDGDELIGLTIFRPLNSEHADEYASNDGTFDEDGDVIYVDLAVSTRGKPVLQALLFGILARLGNRPRIAFKMLKRGKFKVHSLGPFKQILFNRGKQGNG